MQLRFAFYWAASERRKVRMKGETYFKATRQAIHASASSDEASLRKFLVRANALEIAVVGPPFNGYARPAKNQRVAEGLTGMYRLQITQEDHQLIFIKSSQ